MVTEQKSEYIFSVPFGQILKVTMTSIRGGKSDLETDTTMGRTFF